MPRSGMGSGLEDGMEAGGVGAGGPVAGGPGSWDGVPLLHVCECCGKSEVLTPEEAFRQGWDYPPKMGAFGVVSPRTCGDCGVAGTAWWVLAVEGKPLSDLDEGQRAVVHRILHEPFNLMVSDGVD